MDSSEFYHFVFIFLIGTASGITNVLAEGGSIIALPSLILLGYSGGVANGINRVALFFVNLFALKTFYNRDAVEFKFSLRFALMAVPGAVLGTFLAIQINNELYNSILGAALLLVVVSLYMDPNDDLSPSITRLPNSGIAMLIMFFVGFYGGFIQAGVNMLLMVALSSFFHSDETKKSVHKISIAFAYILITSLMFIWTGNVDWAATFVLFAGYVAGNAIGMTNILKKYESHIRIVLFFSAVLMALRLLRIL